MLREETAFSCTKCSCFTFAFLKFGWHELLFLRTYTHDIHKCKKDGGGRKAMEILMNLKNSGIQPCTILYSAALGACQPRTEVENLEKIFGSKLKFF